MTKKPFHMGSAIALWLLTAVLIPMALANDPIDWQRAGELRRREQQGQTLNQEERAYLERAKQQRRLQTQAAEPLPPRETTGLVPITEMGDGLYKEQTGGLYGHGRNIPPESHLKAAQEQAALIVPRDAPGQPVRRRQDRPDLAGNVQYDAGVLGLQDAGRCRPEQSAAGGHRRLRPGRSGGLSVGLPASRPQRADALGRDGPAHPRGARDGPSSPGRLAQAGRDQPRADWGTFPPMPKRCATTSPSFCASLRRGSRTWASRTCPAGSTRATRPRS